MDSIKSKIQKLLNLAGNNSNESEREQAMEMAQKLLAQHNLSIKDVHGLGKPEQDDSLDVRVEKWVTNILHGVCKLYYCSLLTSYRRGKKCYVLIGTTENINVAKDIFQWLIESIKNESKVRVKAFKEEYRFNRLRNPSANEVNLYRNSFRLGAATSIYYKAQDMTKRDHNPSGGGTNQLMVIRNELESANEQAMREMFPYLVTRKQRSSSVHGGAYQAGQSYGNSLNLGKQVGGSSTKALPMY